jgi:hypothetical protein
LKIQRCAVHQSNDCSSSLELEATFADIIGGYWGFNATMDGDEVRALQVKPEVESFSLPIMFQGLSGGAVEGKFYEKGWRAWADDHTKKHSAF